MTKIDLIRKITNDTGYTHKQVEEIIDSFRDTVKNAVADGDRVTIAGFLTFEKKHIDGKSGTSYLHGTAKDWTSPAKDIVTVKLAKAYKEL